jgi:formate dehydrogenase major subunit
MNRWVPWLAALQPEPFVEISPELAGEKGVKNLDIVRVLTPRGEIRLKALVTGRMRPFNIDGRRVHHIGLPWAWGYSGLVTGDVTNDLTPMIADPNVTIHEGKALMCNLERG